MVGRHLCYGPMNETARAVVWRRGGGDGSALSDDRFDNVGSEGIPRPISPCAVAELRTRRSTAKVREDNDHSHDEVQSEGR